jgi:DNA-binding LacI/PurR family transcriptional regulator
MTAPRHIAVVAVNFAFAFHGKNFAQIKALAKPEQRVERYSTRMDPKIELQWYEKIARSPEPTAVICVSTKPEPEAIDLLRSRGVPIVLIDETAKGCASVMVDNYTGGRLVAEHLIDTGHEHMAVVCGDMKVKGGLNAVQRLSGFKDALSRRRLSVERVIEVVFYNHHDGQESMDKLIQDGRPYDAIFCAAGDDCASGMLQVCLVRKVMVPGKIAIVGFDDNESAKQTTPPLTTVRQSLVELAQTAYRLASDPSDAQLIKPSVEKLQPELVVRASAPALAMAKRGAA